jgi:hypothetical protein
MEVGIWRVMDGVLEKCSDGYNPTLQHPVMPN